MLGPTDLTVIVHRAKNLLVKGKTSNDAYATMEFGKTKYVTNVIESSVNPEWHQECQYEMPSGGVLDKLRITITVFNKQHGKFGLQNDDFIGQVEVPLSSIKCTDNKETVKWYILQHKNPKKEKKNRGQVEIGFKYSSREKFSLLPDKKSPLNLKNFTSNVKQKFRRHSEDEDSGVGYESNLRKGQSLDNLHRTPSNSSDRSSNSKRRLSLVQSARGLVKFPNRIDLGNNSKSVSVEVLNNPEIHRVSSLKRSSSGSGSGRPAIIKQHVRNRSMPDTSLRALTSQGNGRNSPNICINGSHLYISGTDSGNNSMSTSLECLQQNNSGSNRDTDIAELHASHNENQSNSRHAIYSPETLSSKLSTLYKPKKYYRLDVKELCKVSTIHEDATVAFQNMSRDELLELCIKQHNTIAVERKQTRELEDYIDTLLVKVMMLKPQILDRSATCTKM